MPGDAPTTRERRGRRERNKTDKLNRIKAASKSLFIERGYDATTTQEIARRAGVAEGTLFRYASSKEDLLLLAFLGDLEEEADEAAATVDPAEPIVEQLLHVFDRVLAFHSRDVELSRHLLRETAIIRNATRRADAQALVTKLQHHLAALLRAGCAAGTIKREIDLGHAAAGIFALHLGLMNEWTNGYLDDETYRAKLRSLIDLMLVGLTPR